MRALTVVEGDRVVLDERPVPEPGAGQVRVRVAGAGLNRADLLQCAGLYPAPPGSPPDIPGLEFAGTIDAVGPGVRSPDLGDRVFGVVGGGAQAEYLVTDADHCAPVPDGLDLVAAGGVPEAFVTAHDACWTRCRLGMGEQLLVHAVGSGVGTAAVQLARAAGCRVVGTARSSWKLERAAELGLDVGVEATRDPDPRALVAALEPHGVADVVLDLVGGPYLEVDVAVAAPRARIAVVGTLAGGRSTISALGLMTKRLELHGTVLRGRNRAEKATATASFTRHVVPLLARHTVRPVIADTVPLGDGAAAYDRLAAEDVFGKLVLVP